MPDSNIDYFIVCHDTKLIEECERSSLGALPNLKYALVGRQPQPYHLDRKRIVVCNELPENIEHLAHLCSFTAWYAIRKNIGSANKHICLLEYDINVTPSFDLANQQLVRENPNDRFVLGYLQASVDHPVFLQSTPWLELTLKKTLQIDLSSFVAEHKNTNPYWLTTTNITLPRSRFNEFVDWFFPLTKNFSADPWGAFVHERALYVFSILYKLKIKCSQAKILEHKEKNSHRLSDLYGDYLRSKGTADFSQDLKADYDILYHYFLAKLVCETS